jgi:hypothetical protein
MKAKFQVDAFWVSKWSRNRFNLTFHQSQLCNQYWGMRWTESHNTDPQAPSDPSLALKSLVMAEITSLLLGGFSFRQATYLDTQFWPLCLEPCASAKVPTHRQNGEC